MYALSIGDVLALILLIRDVLQTFYSSDPETDYEASVTFMGLLEIVLGKFETNLKAIVANIPSQENNSSPIFLSSAQHRTEDTPPNTNVPPGQDFQMSELCSSLNDDNASQQVGPERQILKTAFGAEWTIEEVDKIVTLIIDMKHPLNKFYIKLRKLSTLPTGTLGSSLSPEARNYEWTHSKNSKSSRIFDSIRPKVSKCMDKIKWCVSVDKEAKAFKQDMTSSLQLLFVAWSQLSQFKSNMDPLLDVQVQIMPLQSWYTAQYPSSLEDIKKFIGSESKTQKNQFETQQAQFESQGKKCKTAESEDEMETAEKHDVKIEADSRDFIIKQQLAFILEKLSDMAGSAIFRGSTPEVENLSMSQSLNREKEIFQQSGTDERYVTNIGTEPSEAISENSFSLNYPGPLEAEVSVPQTIHTVAIEECCLACKAQSTLLYLDLAICPDHDESESCSSFQSDDFTSVDSLDLFLEDMYLRNDDGNQAYASEEYNGNHDNNEGNKEEGNNKEGNNEESHNDNGNTEEGNNEEGNNREGTDYEINDDMPEEGRRRRDTSGGEWSEAWKHQNAVRQKRAVPADIGFVLELDEDMLIISKASCAAIVVTDIIFPPAVVVPVITSLGSWTYGLGIAKGWW
ncbi:hypothetical protein BGZ60DRAFT_436261 [Tricladium varicosporioides]|nr:hypothetical protein BGZ60DRAFT_436261 [Hymenoscyphus varicosporioides]